MLRMKRCSIRVVASSVASSVIAAVIAFVTLLHAGGCGSTSRHEAASHESARPWPVTFSRVERTTHAGEPIRGMIARIDLRDPRVRLVGTSKPESVPAGAEVRLESVDAWAARMGTEVAINANYFGVVAGAHGYVAGNPADVLGLCVSDGVVVSPPREWKGQGDPAMVFTPERRGSVVRLAGPVPASIRTAISGVGGSPSDPDRGTPLIEAGKSLASTARIEPDVRHPRSAAGLSADGFTLVLVAIDGRQPTWSVGMTMEELATLLLEQGVADAINLDGGGSTTFLWREEGRGSLETNHPSEKSGFRPVANAFGVRVVQ